MLLVLCALAKKKKKINLVSVESRLAFMIHSFVNQNMTAVRKGEFLVTPNIILLKRPGKSFSLNHLHIFLPKYTQSPTYLPTYLSDSV